MYIDGLVKMSDETKKRLLEMLGDFGFYNKGWSEDMKDEFIENIIYKWREWIKCHI